MERLITEILRGLVDDRDSIAVAREEPDDNGNIVYRVHVAPEDMGRVIGKQGRIAKAIRTVVRSAANRAGEKIILEID